MDRVVDKLLPQGTRRRSVYDLGLTAVRLIANEGWRSFFRKLRLWLKSEVATRRVSLINLLLKPVGCEIVKSKILNELRNHALFSKDPTDYERWFSSVFGVHVPVPGALIATSWSGHDKWGNRAHYALMDIEFDYARELLQEISQRSIEGAIVEFGIYDGWWLEKLYELSQSVGLERDIYGFDSFEGLPEPSLLYDGTFWKKGMYHADYEEVKRRLRIAERKRIHLVKGWFKDTLVSDEAKTISKISYARIDCDLYESAVECLNYLSSRLSNGAILIFDDWPHRITGGEGKAFAEWLLTVPNLAFEFIFYNTWGHLYLRVHAAPSTQHYIKWTKP